MLRGVFAPVNVRNHSARGLRRIPSALIQACPGVNGGSTGSNSKAGGCLKAGLRVWQASVLGGPKVHFHSDFATVVFILVQV